MFLMSILFKFSFNTKHSEELCSLLQREVGTIQHSGFAGLIQPRERVTCDVSVPESNKILIVLLWPKTLNSPERKI